MSNLTSTLLVDGEPVEEGSARAVELFANLLTEIDRTLLEQTSQLLALCPEEVQPHWRRRLDRAKHSLSSITGDVGRFSDDYKRRGLAAALVDARFRKELP